MIKKSQTAEVEARFNAIIEEFGQFLRQSIARRHEGLMREPVTTEEIAQALRLIVGGRKHTGAHRAIFGFADE